MTASTRYVVVYVHASKTHTHTRTHTTHPQEEDLRWFERTLHACITEYFKVNLADVVAVAGESLVYTDFVDKSPLKPYVEVTDLTEFALVVETYLKEYNGVENNHVELVTLITLTP